MLSAHRPAPGRGCRRACFCARLGLWRDANCGGTAVAAHRRGLSSSWTRSSTCPLLCTFLDVGGGPAGEVHRQGVVQLLDEGIDVLVVVHVQGYGPDTAPVEVPQLQSRTRVFDVPVVVHVRVQTF